MKNLTIIFLVCALMGTGCANVPGSDQSSRVQRALDELLPHDFTGDVLAKHNNPYLKFLIRAGNVRRGPQGWSFDWLVYERVGFTTGEIRLGTPPQGF